jgi:hypothetical protein
VGSKVLVTKQLRGCICTLRLSSDFNLMINAKVESQFFLSLVV